MKKLKDELTNFYKENKLLGVNLRENCKLKKGCWKRLKEKRNSNYHLYPPYIGKKYDQEKIMVVGINMNDFGNTQNRNDAVGYLAEKALEEIRNGKKKTFINTEKGYRGSLLWHRLLSFSAILLQTKGVLSSNQNAKYPTKENLSEAYDYISVTNSIKCSPNKQNSEPSKGMWRNCPDFILKKEISILKPKFLLVLGDENYSFVKKVFSLNNISREGEVRLSKFNNDGETVIVIAIAHPASGKGSAKPRMVELKNLLTNI